MASDLPLPALPLNGRFADLQLIGSGGTARVYRARDLTNQDQVAVKILRPEIASLRSRARFDREIRIIRSLTHPNILTLLDVGTIGEGEFEGCPFFVMPLVRGESLRAALERERQFSTKEATRLVTAIATGLAAAHAVGVVHRDIKPENVLLDGDRVLVADFGIARMSDSEGGMTSTTGVIVGTPPYMSPEQITGDRGVDHRSDIYSLGILFYELLTGTPPFTGSSAQAITSRHLIEPPPPLRVVRPDVDLGLEEVITRALAKAPAGRQQSCEAFLHEIDEAAVASKKRRRGRRISSRLVAAGVLAIAALSALLLPMRKVPIDSARILVLPIQRSAPRIDAAIEDRLRSALRDWAGLQVVDNLETTQDTQPASSLLEVAKRGRATGAGLVVAGRIAEQQGLYRLTANLVDVSTTPRILRAGEVSWKTDATPSDSLVRVLGDALLVPRAGLTVTSRSYPAMLAFADGLAAVDQWDLPRAETAFDRATRADEGFTHALLWLAIVRTWQERPLPEWSYLVVRAREKRGTVGTDSSKLLALSQQAANNLPAGCEIWRRLTRTAAGDFANWYGLASCLRSDSTVVVDRNAPGGWRFRASRSEAIAAYRRALELLPGSHRALSSGSFESVRRFMLTSMTDIVSGQDASGGIRFGGMPSVRGDSLVLQPVRVEDIQSGRLDALPPTHRAAVIKQRLLFDSLTTWWATAFPESSDALLARAISFEMLGDERMLSTVIDARRRAVRAPEQLQAGLAHVRMLVKRGLESRGFLIAARALADSLIERFETDSRVDEKLVANLAALRGRIDLASRLMRRKTGSATPARTPLEVEGTVLLLYAAGGSSTDSVAAAAQRVARLIDQQEPSQRLSLQMTWISRAATLAYPDAMVDEARSLGGKGDYLLDAQLEVLRGERAKAVAGLTSIVATRTAPPSDVPLDAVCPEANTVAAAGDARTAFDWIRRTLSSFDVAPPDFLSDGAAAAVIGRCLTMAATLAQKAGQQDLSSRWSGAAQLLTGR